MYIADTAGAVRQILLESANWAQDNGAEVDG